jgi:hypothetical protein
MLNVWAFGLPNSAIHFMEINMSFGKLITIIIFVGLIAACSSSPSDSDINEAFKSQTMGQLDNAFAPLGFKASDVFDFNIKIENKAKQDDGRWLVQTETTMIAKRDSSSFTEQQQLGLMMFGQFKKGQPIGQPTKGNAHVVKGDKGWIISN